MHNFSNQFTALHYCDEALLLTNIWDAASAKLAESQGAKAIATSSAALAWACGYPDGGKIPRNELIAAVARIRRVVSLPITVDIEDGYSANSKEIIDLLYDLRTLNVQGINLEDGSNSAALLCEKISAIKQEFQDKMFINARTDVYLQSLVAPDEARKETIVRCLQYQSAGADGIFIPGLLDTNELMAIKSALSIKEQTVLNVMIPSSEYNIQDLIEAGVKRFSTGPTTFLDCYRQLSTKEAFDFNKMNSYFDV